MSTIRSLTAAVAFVLAIPFAGVHASGNCAEAISINSTSKDTGIASVQACKQAAKSPVQAKIALDSGKRQTAILPSGGKKAWAKAFQKHKDHCC